MGSLRLAATLLAPASLPFANATGSPALKCSQGLHAGRDARFVLPVQVGSAPSELGGFPCSAKGDDLLADCGAAPTAGLGDLTITPR